MKKITTFWKVNEENGYLSNWRMAPFIYENMKFQNTEQAFMYLKAKLFGDEESMKHILATADPKICKSIGREVYPFEQKLWDKEKYKIMLDVNIEKYRQNSALRAYLLATGDDLLVEASPVDKVWGAGVSADKIKTEEDITGENLLGKVLMEVRDLFRSGNETCKIGQ